MKRFKYKFSKLITTLIIVGLVLCATAFVLDVYFSVTVGISTAANPVYPIIQYALMYFVSVMLFAILLSILISSYYSVDEKYFVTSFGFIKSKYDIKEVDIIMLDRNTNKLSVTFKSGEYIIVVVNEQWYNDFIEAILAVNPKIEYTIQSKENNKKDK